MKQVKVGSQALLGYLPALVIQNVLNNKIKKDLKPPISIEMKTVSLFADISGFTKLSEAFSKKGRTGSEFLAFCLNRYMELLSKNGGDIFKFAGDALLVIWPMERQASYETTCRRALQCALSIQKKLNNLEMSKGKILSVKVGLGFGKCKVLLVGGKFDRFEYLIVGEAMRQACTSECHCKGGGETVASEDVYKLISQYYDFVEAEPDTEHGPGDGLKYYKFIKAKTNDKIQVVAGAFLMRKNFRYDLIKNYYSVLKTFVPAAITIYLDIEKETWCKESRLITIMFLNLTIDLKHTETEDGLKYIQKIIKTVQRCVYRTRGSLNKFLMDDKGSVLLIAWGIPPLSADDDPIRAVLTGLNVVNELKNIKNDKWGNCGAKIGITTGCCFSGVSGGSGDRREYTLLGEVVNLAARYMQQSMKICNNENKKYQILVSEKTKNLIQNKIFCRWVDKGKLKGFSNEFNFYEPVEFEENLVILKYIKTHRDNPKLDINGVISNEHLKECMFMIGRDKELQKCKDILYQVCNSQESKMIFLKGELGSGKSLLARKLIFEFFENNRGLRNELPEHKKNAPQFLFTTIQLPTTFTTPYNGCCEFLKKMYKSISKNMLIKNKTALINNTFQVKCDEFGEMLINNSFFNYIKIIDEILSSDIIKHHFNISEEIKPQINTLFLQFEEKKIDKYFAKRNLKNYQTGLNKFFIFLIKYYQDNFLRKLPLILIIEDTHLIDDYSILLIKSIHNLPKTFILCSFQDSINPYVKQKIPFLEADEIIQLKGLQNTEDVIKLISNYCKKNLNLNVTSIQDDLKNVILDHSFKNNPLFIIEIISSLLEQNCLSIEADKKLVATKEFKICYENLDWSSLNIPFIIEKIVGSIIDSLKCQEIIVLKHASVIGAIFDIDKLNKLSILNNYGFEDLCQMIYRFSQKNIVEILYDLNPKKFVAKFSLPFLKEVLYKRMLVETKNEIHIKIARLMESSKFSYLPRKMETFLLNFHLLEEGKTILDHMDDSKNKEIPILKEANLRIKVLKETTDKLRDIDFKIEDETEEDAEYKSLSKRSMPIVRCGILEKKSDKGITWEKRFIVMTKNKFYYWYTSDDYKENKQYLGMFELKNIYSVKNLKEGEFSDKAFLMEISVSSHYKKDMLKGPRDYIFAADNKNALMTWVIALSFLRAKAIYDEFRYNFGTLNFPLNHEKNRGNDKGKNKRKFYFEQKFINDNNILPFTQFPNNKSKNDKKKVSVYLKDFEDIEKKREEIENQKIQNLKNRVIYTVSLTFGYFLSSIQNNVNNIVVNEKNDFNENIISLPKHFNKSLSNNKYYNKIQDEYKSLSSEGNKENDNDNKEEPKLNDDKNDNNINNNNNKNNNVIDTNNRSGINKYNNEVDNDIKAKKTIKLNMNSNSKGKNNKINKPEKIDNREINISDLNNLLFSPKNEINNNINNNNNSELDKRSSIIKEENPSDKANSYFNDLKDSNIINNNNNSNDNIMFTDENLIKSGLLNNGNLSATNNKNFKNNNNPSYYNTNQTNSILDTRNKLIYMTNINLKNDVLDEDEQLKLILADNHNKN